MAVQRLSGRFTSPYPRWVRVIAGTAKGTRLGQVPAGVRPVSDRVREGLFSSIGPRIEEARVLDLYAGTGAVGIEALSRGAAHATFVDHAPPAVAAVRENLRRTGLEDRGAVVRSDVLRFLRRAGEDTPGSTSCSSIRRTRRVPPSWIRSSPCSSVKFPAQRRFHA